MRKICALLLSACFVWRSLPLQAAQQQFRQVQEPVVKNTPVYGPLIQTVSTLDFEIPTGKIGALTLVTLAAESDPRLTIQSQTARQALYYLSWPGVAPALQSSAVFQQAAKAFQAPQAQAALAGIAQHLSQIKRDDPALSPILSQIRHELGAEESSPEAAVEKLAGMLPALFDGLRARAQDLENYRQAANGMLVLADQTMRAHWSRGQKQAVAKTIERIDSATAGNPFSIALSGRYGAPQNVQVSMPESLRPVMEEFRDIVKILGRLSQTNPFIFRGAMAGLARDVAKSVAQAASVDELVARLGSTLEAANQTDRLAQLVSNAGGAQPAAYESMFEDVDELMWAPRVDLRQIESEAAVSTDQMMQWIEKLTDNSSPEDVAYLSGKKLIEAITLNPDLATSQMVRSLEDAISSGLASNRREKASAISQRERDVFTAYIAIIGRRPDLIGFGPLVVISKGLTVDYHRGSHKRTSWILKRIHDIFSIVEQRRPELISAEQIVFWNAALEARKKNLADMHDSTGWVIFPVLSVLPAIPLVFGLLGAHFGAWDSDPDFIWHWSGYWAASAAGLFSIGHGTKLMFQSSARNLQKALAAAFAKRATKAELAEKILRQVIRFDPKKRRWVAQDDQAALFKAIARQESYRSMMRPPQ